MKGNLKCFLDMDGVLDDFVGAACEVHGRPSPYNMATSWGIFEIEKLWGIGLEEFWKPIVDTPGFWRNLRKTPEADEIVSLVENKFGSENVAILTDPSVHDMKSVEEKQQWIEKFYPQFRDRIIFTGAKEFLAGPERVLVDDKSRNIAKFMGAGGRAAITVPRPWNLDFATSETVVSAIERGLEWLK